MNFLRSYTHAAFGLLLFLWAQNAGAQYTGNTWNPQGADPQNPYLSDLSGIWELANWSTDSTFAGQATPQNFVENQPACFAVNTGTGTPPFTVTMNANHTVAGIFNGSLTGGPGPCSVTIQGTGTMLLPPGSQTFNAATPGSITISVPMTDADSGNPCQIEAGGNGGTLWLNGPNTFTGNVTVNSGTLQVSSIADTGTSALGMGTGLALNGGTLRYSGSTAATTSRQVDILLPSTLFLSGEGSLELSGPIMAQNKLTMIGTNTLTLSGTADNSYLGMQLNPGATVVLAKASSESVHALNVNTTLNLNTPKAPACTLQLGGSGDDQIADTCTIDLHTWSVLDMNGHSETFDTLILNNLSAVQLVNTKPNTTSTLTLPGGGILLRNAGSAGGSGNITIDAVISDAVGTGPHSLTYSGTGTLTLLGANTYATRTTIRSGKVLVNNVSGSGTGTGPVYVNSGGTLGGTGTISGATTVNLGGTLSTVDNATGPLTFGSSLSLSGGTSMEISKAAGSADQIVMSGGTATLGGTLNVTNLAGTLVLDDSFRLFSGTLAGGFTNYTLPALAPGLAWDTSGLAAGGSGTIRVALDCGLTASAGPNKSICSADPSVIIGGSPTASGGSGTYIYSWAPTTGLDDPTKANPTATPSATTTYTVTVLDSAGPGCAAVTSSMTVSLLPECKSPVTITNIVSNGNGSITIKYSGGAGASFTLMKTTDLSVTQASWTAAAPDQPSTPGSFTITPASNEFYRIRSN